MEQAHDLVRPWRRATIAVSAVAAIELLLLTVVGIALFGDAAPESLPELGGLGRHAADSHHSSDAGEEAAAAAQRGLVMVLNGNGQAGAAHAAADRVQAHGYLLGNVGNAPQITPHSLVMFRPGYAGEARRLGRDLRVRIVRPLDGMRTLAAARRAPRAHPGQVDGSIAQRAWSRSRPGVGPFPKRKLSSVYAWLRSRYAARGRLRMRSS